MWEICFQEIQTLNNQKINFIKEHIMKRSIIAAAVFSSFFMSAGVFAADVDTGTLTIKGNIA